jgi:hypothetical protein
LVLGNYELWDAVAGGMPSQSGSGVDDIVAQYRKLCDRLGLILLHNDLLIIRNTNYPQEKMVRLIPENQLRDMNEGELRAACLNGSIVVLGGLGFSGLNDEFNATHGLYRNTIRSRDDDRKESQRFEFVHDKLKQVAGSERVIVLTHTPKNDWSSQPHHEGWIYVNGHTHRNEYYCGVEKTVYA